MMKIKKFLILVFIFVFSFVFNNVNALELYTKKVDLNEKIGVNPHGSLTLGKNGSFYGMTNYGGLNNAGVIFEYNPITDKYFKKIDLSYEKGSHPYGSLTLGKNGKFYGMTVSGGANNEGVIFEYDINTNTYTKKVDLKKENGRYPWGSLTLTENGSFIGMTISGGANNDGVIFNYNPNTNTYTKKIDLKSENGRAPKGSLTLGKNGSFYGMTTSGGVNNAGVIFSYNPNTNTYTKQIDLNYENGMQPSGSLTLSNDGTFYGMTSDGGAEQSGVIFNYNPKTNAYTKKVDFNKEKGSYPFGSLILGKDKTLYGMTSDGGLNNAGVVFQYNPVTNKYVKKVDLLNEEGSYPFGSLSLAKDGNFYGMTVSGGAYSNGVIFKFYPNNSSPVVF